MEADEPKPNGHKDPNPNCTWHERRLDSIDSKLRTEVVWREDLSRAVHSQAREIGAVKESVHSIESDMFDQVAAMAGVVGELRGLRRDMLSVRLPLPSLDYSEGSDTEIQDRPKIVARAKGAEHRVLTLEEENAALRATIAERDRQSVRAREKAEGDAGRAEELAKIARDKLAISSEKEVKTGELVVARWKITAGVITGVVLLLTAIWQTLGPVIVKSP